MRRLGLTISLIGAMLLMSGRAPAQTAADVAAARDLFIQGSTLSREGKWEAARDRFEKSYALKEAPITLYSLGVAQRETGLYVEALQTLRAFLNEEPEPGTKQYYSPARKAINQLELKVAKINLSVSPATASGLRLMVDSDIVDPAALGAPRLVNPGTHSVRVEAPGYVPVEERLTLDEGGVATLDLQLEVAESPAQESGTLPPPPLHDPEPSQLPESAPDRTLPYGLIGGGVASLSTGVVIGIVGISQAAFASTPDEAAAGEDKAMVADLFGAAGIAAITVGIVMLVSGAGVSSATGAAETGSSSALFVDGRGLGYRY